MTRSTGSMLSAFVRRSRRKAACWTNCSGATGSSAQVTPARGATCKGGPRSCSPSPRAAEPYLTIGHGGDEPHARASLLALHAEGDLARDRLSARSGHHVPAARAPDRPGSHREVREHIALGRVLGELTPVLPHNAVTSALGVRRGDAAHLTREQRRERVRILSGVSGRKRLDGAAHVPRRDGPGLVACAEWPCAKERRDGHTYCQQGARR